MTEELVRHLEAVTLCCGKWTAQVSPRYGMNTLALCWNGRAVLRSPGSLEEFLRLPEGYGTPPLLPANRTKDGTFEFEGRRYTLPINDRFHTHKHGYVHTSAFAVTSRSESTVEGILENHGEIYPFKWVTDLACVHGLQRSRFLLRPLPSGRASLAVSLL